MNLLKKLRGYIENNISSSLSINVSIEEQDVVPVEERIKTAFKSKNGLYPHEVLLLSYAETYYIDEVEFQGFWWYRYGVKSPKVIINDLIERGFIEVGGIKEALQKQTVASMKEVLNIHSLKKSGKKGELIQRLVENISEKNLDKYFPKRTYRLTELGIQEVESEKYVIYIHKNSIDDLDIWALNELVYTEPYMSFRDKIWKYLNEKSMEYYSKRLFGLYRNCRFHMAKFLEDENRIEAALGMMTEVLYQDLSGMQNHFDIEELDLWADSFFPYENSLVTIPPGILMIVKKYKNKLEITDEELKEILLVRIAKFRTPFHLFEKEECVDIVLHEINNNEKELKKIYKKAEKRFKEKYNFN